MTALELVGAGIVAGGVGLLTWLLWQSDAFGSLARWRRWHSRLLLARRQGHAAPTPSVRAMRAAVPPETGHAPLWRMQPRPHVHQPTPARLLFLGDAAAALPALLAAVAPQGPAQDARPGEDPFWRWWQLPRLIAIELCPPPPAEEAPQDLLWLHALRTLARTQPERPLDGLVLCISAALLRADPKVAEPVMRLLARRIRETAALLNQRLPVHVLLTGLQDLAGYATVRDALPEPLLTQALGWCAPPVPPLHPWKEASDTWQSSLNGLRLSLMARERTVRERHDIHRFFEALTAQGVALNPLAQTLGLDANVLTPLQGIYLTAAAPQAAFVHDVFDRFLPMSAEQASNPPT